ncbi:MAG: hypothetical protein JO061_19395, partial [Acidobacteriaceae bacterium]|nr:hypothetical protein [Acidobacteriaceae bacterium]
MSALWEAPFGELVDLTQLGPADLDALLAEEIDVWQHRFAWDFRPAADLLRRFLHLRSLSGRALRSGGEIVGYSYYVCEGRKGLIGDFYVRADHVSASREMLLLGGVVQSAMQIPGMRRIESQLMLLRSSASQQPLPFLQNVKRHDRLFMQIARDAILRLAPGNPAFRVAMWPWSERYQEEMAH